MIAAVLAVVLAVTSPAAADSARGGAPQVPPQAPYGLEVTDVPEDAGHALELRWHLSPSDSAGGSAVTGYRIERATSPGGPWTLVDAVPAGVTAALDVLARRNVEYYYRVIATGPGGATPASSVTGPVRATAQWIRRVRLAALAALALLIVLLFSNVVRAEGGWRPRARRVAAVDAIDEAVRRAAAAGRPLLFVPGLRDVDDLQTEAGIDLLGEVARRCARAGARLRVRVAFPLAFALAEDVVRRAYESEGRLDALDADVVELLAPDPTAAAATVMGGMRRDQPAADVLAGGFASEALLLVENGAAAGAFQVAGSANLPALPFLVVSADHTLVGEELFGAGPVLSDDPRRLATRRVTEIAIVLLVAAVLIGCALETAGIHGFSAFLGGGPP